jgi:hypothetical protein
MTYCKRGIVFRREVKRIMKKKIIGIFVCMLMIVTTIPVVSALNFQTTWYVNEYNYSRPYQNTPPSAAGNIAIRIIAKVYEVDDPYNLLGGAIKVNDTITGKYIYDSGTPDENPNPAVGTYRHTSSSFGIEVKAGGLTFKTNPSDVDFIIQILDNYYTQDAYIVSSPNNLQLSNGMLVNEISWFLVNNFDLTVVTSDVLPTTAPVLADWTEINDVRLIGSHPSQPFKIYGVKAHVTKATKPKAVNVNGVESDWRTSPVTMLCQYNIPFMQFWDKFFERFPYAFPILRHIMGL